jgi:hypothetical protein
LKLLFTPSTVVCPDEPAYGRPGHLFALASLMSVFKSDDQFRLVEQLTGACFAERYVARVDGKFLCEEKTGGRWEAFMVLEKFPLCDLIPGEGQDHDGVFCAVEAS